MFGWTFPKDIRWLANHVHPGQQNDLNVDSWVFQGSPEVEIDFSSGTLCPDVASPLEDAIPGR